MRLGRLAGAGSILSDADADVEQVVAAGKIQP
jgi:hypothetical protein